jgi:hypothetical protein
MSEPQLKSAFPGTEQKRNSSMAFVYVTIEDIILRLEQVDPGLFFPTIGGEAQTLRINASEKGVNVSVHPDQSQIVEW